MVEYIQKPERCDCHGRWEIILYDDSRTGVVFEGDSGGNWDVTDRMPAPEEVEEAWQEYYHWVAKHGEDPLGQVLGVEYEEEVKERWTFRFAPSLLGVVVVSARPAHGKQIRAGELRSKAPAYVLEYLDLNPEITIRPVLAGFSNMREVAEALKAEARDGVTVTHSRGGIIYSDVLTYRKARPAAVVKADLRKLARGK